MEPITKDEFIQWYNNFVLRRRGTRVSDDWYDLVEEKHKSIREFLGGVTKTIKIELKDIQQDIDFQGINELTWNLAVLIPGYFYEYQCKRIDFINSLVASKDSNDVKRAKHVKRWMLRNKTSEEISKKVNDILSKIGQKWSEAKTADITQYVSISTDPRAFCMVGCYDVDNTSCFRQTQANQIHKYNLGAHPNTFIVLVGNTENLFSENNKDINARFWGVGNNNHTIFSILNYYVRPKLPEGTVLVPVHKAITELLGGKKVKVFDNRIKVTNVYQNRVINRSFCKSDVDFQDINIVFNYLTNQTTYCNKCQNHDFQKYSYKLDDQWYCWACHYELPECAVTKKKITNAADAILDGQRVKIHRSLVVKGDFVLCGATGLFYPKKEVVELRDGSKVNKGYAEQQKYEECEDCHLWSHWSKFSRVNDEEKICTFCAKRTTSRIAAACGVMR